MTDEQIETFASGAEWDAWRKSQEWYPCSHCGGSGIDDDAASDPLAWTDKCRSCAGSGDGRRQTVW